MSQWYRHYIVRCQIIHQMCIDWISDVWTCNSSSSSIPSLRSKCALEKEIRQNLQNGCIVLYISQNEDRSPFSTKSQETWTNHICWSMVLKGKEQRWKLKGWVWKGGGVAPVSNGWSGCFSQWRWKAPPWPWSLNNSSISLGCFQKAFLKDAI